MESLTLDGERALMTTEKLEEWLRGLPVRFSASREIGYSGRGAELRYSLLLPSWERLLALDLNQNGIWEACDGYYYFGQTGDVPVMGAWSD